MALDYTKKFQIRTSKTVKKCRKKSGKIPVNNSNDDKPVEDLKKCTRKQRNNLRRHKTVLNVHTNSNDNQLDEEFNNTALKSLQGQQINTLTLFGIGKLPKSHQNNKLKNESRRKFRKGGFIANATVNVGKMKSNLLFNENVNIESCSSDDLNNIKATTKTITGTTIKTKKRHTRSK
ncbi:hypothetical protein PV327_010910 [Microctonus hyperodae]|nr:hypothetical protein PV327_010910 [Microctonus hyperodae]